MVTFAVKFEEKKSIFHFLSSFQGVLQRSSIDFLVTDILLLKAKPSSSCTMQTSHKIINEHTKIAHLQPRKQLN